MCCSERRPSIRTNVCVCMFMAMMYSADFYYGTHLTTPYDQVVCIISMTSWLMINGLIGFFGIVQYAMFVSHYEGQMVRNITKRSLAIGLLLYTITFVMWTTIGWVLFVSYPMISLVTIRFYETFMLVLLVLRSSFGLILGIISYSVCYNL